MSKLAIVYACLCAVVAVVACSGQEDDRLVDGARSAPSSAQAVVDKALDGGATTSDAAP